ncbi:MAG: hypothetical protein ACKVOB_05865 [Sphingomonas sp.]
MTQPPLSSALLLLLVAPEPAGGGTPEKARVVQTQEFTFHQRVIIRVPRMPEEPLAASASARAPVRWIEKKARKCVGLETLIGASVPTSESVDLVVNDGRRLRARFADGCAGLDFYSGFYIRPTTDGQVCAKRDVVRSRSGGACQIREFRQLIPQR